MSSSRQPNKTASAEPSEAAPVSPFITDSHRDALEVLGSAYRESRPLAILIGDGDYAAKSVIGTFVDGISDDVAVARLTKPVADADSGMREILQTLGYEPNDADVTDSGDAFSMFLSLQLMRHRRTVVSIEQAQDIGPPATEIVRRLVELEKDGKYGLMVILSGRPGLNEMLQEPPLNASGPEAAVHIALARFTPADTKEYIRRQIQAAAMSESDHLFAFDAITLIHELSDGIPDAVSRLCSRCLQLAEEKGAVMITTDLVEEAAESLRMDSQVQQPDAETISTDTNGSTRARGRLIARMNGERVHDRVVDQDYIVIGRSKMCDICLTSGTVSAHHAIIVNSSVGVDIIDLRSTNGTFIGDRPIKHYPLRDNDVIKVGDYMIEYVEDEDRRIP